MNKQIRKKNSQAAQVVTFLKNNSNYGFTITELCKQVRVKPHIIYNISHRYPELVTKQNVDKKNYYLINEELTDK